MKVVVILPAWNEGVRIQDVIHGILKYTPHIFVVDDGSHDETAEIAMRSGARVIRHAINRGQGAALKTGTLFAREFGADFIIHMDADGQHDPSSINLLLRPLLADEADVVFGSRYMGIESNGIPLMRRIVHVGAKIFNRYVLGVPDRVTDPQSGLRAMHVSTIDQIPFEQDGFAHCSEILQLVTHSDLRWCEVPVRVRYTPDSLAKGPAALKLVWQLFIGKIQRYL